MIYTTKNSGKYKKEKIYKRIKDYYLKIALTGDNKLLFRCYDMNNLDCNCYQLIKSADEIFELNEDMKMYETSSVLYNVITKRFSYNYSINHDRDSDKIIIEANDKLSYENNIIFELRKESITCLKEYIYILCQTIKQLKEDSLKLKESKNKYDLEYNNIKKIPDLTKDIKELKKQIELIKDSLNDKQEQINTLKEMKKKDKKLIEENTTQINSLKEENKNLKVAINDGQDEIEKINKVINDKKFNFQKPKMSINYFNKKYRTNIGYYQITFLNLEGSYIGNIGLRDLCKLEFIHLERLILSNNYIKDITSLENAKFIQLKELILFFNNIYDINILEKVNFHFLTRLGLSDNHISNINVLENVDFLQLEKLALSNNNISDINIFKQVQFKLLRELKLSGNNILI